VLEYHFDSTVEMELAENYAGEVQAYYLAMAGLNFARIVLQRDNAAYDAPDEPWALLSALTSTTCIAPQQLLEWAKSLAQAQENKASSAGGSTSSTTTGDRLQLETVNTVQEDVPECVRLSIVDEARKLPINALLNGDEINEEWRQIFESFFVAFEIPPEATNALIDWIDKSDGHLEGGGEDEYYEALPHPYTTPDRPLQVPGELRLVRHFDCETLAKLFPGKECKDMADIDLGSNEYLTVYGGAEAKVNLNTASEAVLNAITLNNNTVCVSSILEKRIVFAGQLISEPIKAINQVDPSCTFGAAPGSGGGGTSPGSAQGPRGGTPPGTGQGGGGGTLPGTGQVAGVNSAYFRVEAQGEVGGRIKKKIVAVLQRGGQQALPNVVYFKVE
jgi:type II secretory pathway component PulK